MKSPKGVKFSELLAHTRQRFPRINFPTKPSLRQNRFTIAKHAAKRLAQHRRLAAGRFTDRERANILKGWRYMGWSQGARFEVDGSTGLPPRIFGGGAVWFKPNEATT